MSKLRRRQALLDVLSEHSVPNQERLAALLASRGVATTQATLSRDLRDLGVGKRGGVYVLPAPGEPRPALGPALEHSVRMFMLWAREAGSTVVLKTRPGNASSLAADIDRAAPVGVVGTIAGDDTVFLAAASPSRAKSLTRMLSGLLSSGRASHLGAAPGLAGSPVSPVHQAGQGGGS